MEQQSISQDGKSGSEVVMNNNKSNNMSDGDAATKKKTEQLPNGLHMKQGNGIKEKQGTPMVARFYSRKRGRETTPEIVIKKPKVSERVVTDEEKITDTLERTADMLLVLAGLGQMRAGRPPSATEVQLAVDAQTNLKSLVARVAPSSLLSKKSLENMLETMGMRVTAENKIEAVARPQIEKPKVEGEEADSDSESSDSLSAKDDATQNPTGGIMASPSGLFLDDEAEADLKQNDDEEEFQDEHSQLMRHKQLVKIVQQLKAESYVPQPMAAVSNAYMNTVAPCMICHVHVKDTTSVVVCDGCEKVYHQKCLPHNYLRFLPKGDWSCPKCVLDGGGKLQPPKYGPVRKGIPAATKVTVKQQPETKQSMGVPQQTVANGPSAASAEQQLLKQNQQVGGKTAMPNTGHAVSEVADKNTIANNTEKAKSDSANSVLAVPQTSAEDMLDEAVAGASSAENENTGNQPIPGQPICLHVDWIGEPEQVTDGKAYYSSCCVGGNTYKLQDCALFRPETPEIPPYIARLQVLWEELETGAKWVRVNWCYYPNDMPSVAGRPDMPESDEVYESNHCDNNLVGSIQGPCQVLLPSKYYEEKQRRAKLQASGFPVGDLPPIFLCRWTYDAPKGVFRKVAEGS